MFWPEWYATLPVREALNLARDVVKKYPTRLGYREWLRERTRRFHIHALPHQDAFTNEDDDVGLDPLRVRARAHDRPRALLELNRSRVPFAVIESELGESHFPLAIIEARRVQEALPIWEEPRPVHARFALRLIAGQNRDGSRRPLPEQRRSTFRRYVPAG